MTEAKILAVIISRIAETEPPRFRRVGARTMEPVPRITRTAGESDADFCERAASQWLSESGGTNGS